MKKIAKFEKLKRLFEANNKLTVKEINKLTLWSPRTVREYLSILVKDELIIAIGETNKRYYKRNYAIDEKPIVIKVLQNDIEVGLLSFTYAKGYIFSYNENFQDERFPAMPDSINSSFSLFSVFENLIPESKRRERLLLKDGKILNPLELLLELDNTHGSFDFLNLQDNIKEKNKIPSWKSVKENILGHNEYVNLLEYGLDIPPTALQGIMKNRELYSSLSGYQHKIDINIDHNTQTIIRANKTLGEVASYLLKPYASDTKIKNTPYLALNEHLFMSFAKNILKLDVPYSAVLLGENRDFYLLVKRYDRFNGYKYHQYDFAQQLNIESEDKYDISIISILEKFTQVVSDKKSKEDIFVFIVYSSLIKHGDFHAKNLGLIEVGNKKWALAPLYDIISTYPYEGKDSDDFGIGFDYKNPKKRKYKMKEYTQMAQVLNIEITKANKLLKETIKRFQVYFPKYIEQTKNFEKMLEYPNTLSKKLKTLYNEKNIEFDKLGLLNEVGLKRVSYK